METLGPKYTTASPHDLPRPAYGSSRREVYNMAEFYKTARAMLNRRVKIRTKSGKTHIGKIVKVTGTHVHLQKTRRRKGKVGTTFFAPFILPLVLFDLLAIVLLI
jgi:hypothetical protein